MPQIDPLPAAPTRADPANFPARADAFVGSLDLFRAQANALSSDVNDKSASTSASAASALAAPGTFATSTTSLPIGAGSKTLSVQSGKTFVVGQFVTIAQTSTPGNWMAGQITAYNSSTGAMTVNVLAFAGSGTATAWTIGLSSPMRFIAASAAQIWDGSDATTVVTPAGLLAAAAPQALVDTATITPDFASGINFTLTIGGNRTLANPANAQPGDSGVIVVTQDGTGGRSLAFGSAWKFPGGAPSLSPAANAIDAIGYYAISSTLVLCSIARGFA